MQAPSELRLSKDKRLLTVSFGAVRHEFPAEMLRVMSPSAEVQGHSAADRRTIGGKRDVGIMTIEPVGNYAVRIGFDDMHDTGIYTWSFFRELGENKDTRWQTYLKDLEAKGMTREPRGRSS